MMVESDFNAETQRAQSGKGAAERKQEKTPQMDTDEHRFTEANNGNEEPQPAEKRRPRLEN